MGTSVEFTEADVTARIVGLPAATAAAVICAMVGHSRVQSCCLGYYSCCRCNAQVGDVIGSSYAAAKMAVVVDHHCDMCRANRTTLTWKDTLQLPEKATQYLADLADEARSRAMQEENRIQYERARQSIRASNERQRVATDSDGGPV